MSADDVPPEVGAPGWDAIDEALRPIYGAEKPLHWGTLISYRLGGPDPLDGISAYLRAGPVPHWHFVTFGFSELYEKESTNANVSGYGFELTFRLARSHDETAPPPWVLNFLQNLARYVFKTGNVLASGDYVDANGPIALGVATSIRAVVLARDPELTQRGTPNGRLEFLQVVGVTLDELAAMRAWNTDRFLELVRESNPLLVTDLARDSALVSSRIAERVRQGTESEGSSTAELLLGHCRWKVTKRFLGEETLVVTLGANGVRNFKAVLPARVAFGRDLSIVSGETLIRFVPGSASSWRVVADAIEITMAGDTARRLSEKLEARAGLVDFHEIPRVEFHIVPSEVRDADGEVVDVVG